MLHYIVLGMLLNEDLTGYELKKKIEAGVGVFYRASYGSLYPGLKRLTSDGHLLMYEKPYGNRKKIFYQITAEGEKFFNAWLVSPMNVLDGTNVHLAKVYFFDNLSDENRNQQLSEYQMNNESYLRKLQALKEHYDKLENKDQYYYKLSTLYYGICVTAETIRWCQHIKAKNKLADLLHLEA